MQIKSLILSTVIVLSSFFLHAQDRMFVRTYQSMTLAKGSKDIEAWSTYRSGRQYFYNRLDQRLELEVGLTDKLQTSVYMNVEHSAEGAHLDTLGGIADTSMSGVYKSTLFSVSSEWKLKLSDPVANAIGSAIYAELTFAPSEIEVEGKLILDKKTDKNIFALNLVGEYEVGFDVEKGKTETEKELKAEVDLAYMRMLKPHLGLGLELRNHNVFVKNEMEHSAMFGGPTLFYSDNNFFIILNVLPQWSNLKVSDENPKSLDLNEYEKVESRLLIGFSF